MLKSIVFVVCFGSGLPLFGVLIESINQGRITLLRARYAIINFSARRSVYAMANSSAFAIGMQPKASWAEKQLIKEMERPARYELKGRGKTEIRIHRIQKLLAVDGVNPNIKVDDRNPFLITAVENQHVLLAELLLNHPRIDVNSVNTHKYTALHCAIYSRIWLDLDMVRLLLSMPAIDVNKHSGIDGATALIEAVMSWKIEIVQLLLNRSDIQVNKPYSKSRREYSGFTPLMSLFIVRKYFPNIDEKRRRVAIARLLVQDYRTEINIVSDSGMTALMLAALSNDTECIIEILQHKDIDLDRKNTYGQTAEQIAHLHSCSQAYAVLQAYAQVRALRIAQEREMYEPEHDIMVKPAFP